MIDTDFEKKAALLTNEGYFSRARELAQTMGIRAAWEQVEKELPFGLRRYTHFISFEKAKTMEAEGSLVRPHFKLD